MAYLFFDTDLLIYTTAVAPSSDTPSAKKIHPYFPALFNI